MILCRFNTAQIIAGDGGLDECKHPFGLAGAGGDFDILIPKCEGGVLSEQLMEKIIERDGIAGVLHGFERVFKHESWILPLELFDHDHGVLGAALADEAEKVIDFGLLFWRITRIIGLAEIGNESGKRGRPAGLGAEFFIQSLIEVHGIKRIDEAPGRGFELRQEFEGQFLREPGGLIGGLELQGQAGRHQGLTQKNLGLAGADE